MRKCALLLACLSQAATAQPRDAAGWKALGVTYAAAGDYARAEQPFHRACLLDPALPDACLYFGRALYLLDRFEPALDVLRRARERDPRNGQIVRVEALCLEALGRAADADKAFQEAMRLAKSSAPDDDPAIDYGVFLFRQGRAEEALPPLRSSDAGRAHLELGCVLLALDRVSEARPHLERAVAADPTSRRAHLLLGKALLRLGKPDLAQPHLDQARGTGSQPANH